MALSKSFAVLTLCLLLPNKGLSYTPNKMNNGSTVKWGTDRPDLVVHRDSSTRIIDADVVDIADNTLREWGGASSLSVNAQFISGSSPSSEVNDLYFSSESSLLGPSVAGVTVSTTDQSTGELIEADIIINDNLFLSTDPGSSNFIGDIIAHELGHYLGLAHSEVQFATMFYRLTKGQHQIEGDDKAGVRSLYSSNSYAKLSGKIVGGSDLIGVFGAHIQAVSLKSGRIAGAAVSEVNGGFTINGLDGDDHYYLYIDRLKSPENLPTRFKEVKSDYCYSGSSYRGSFFQSCYTRDEGRPQAIYLGAGQSKSVGEVTIRCGLETPVDYMQAKSGGELDLNILESRNGKTYIGESLVGFFNQGDVVDRIADEFYFEVDIDDLPIDSGNEDFFVEVKTVSQGLNSPMRLSMELENNSSALLTSQTTDLVEFRDDESINMENKLRMRIDLNDPSANHFRLTLTPEALEAYKQRTGLPLNQFIPDFESFADPLNFYFLTVHIVEEDVGEFSVTSAENGMNVRSNRSCPGAPETYSVDKTRTLASQVDSVSRVDQKNSPELNALGCGLIALDGGGGPSGPGGAFPILTLFGVCLLCVGSASGRLRNMDF